MAFQFNDEGGFKENVGVGLWGGDLGNPTVEQWAIENTKGGRPFWGLRGDTDKDGLRLQGRGKGKVARNHRGLVIGGTDRIGAMVNMDSHSMQFYRNGNEIVGAIVGGFPPSVRIAALVKGQSVTLSFPGGPKAA